MRTYFNDMSFWRKWVVSEEKVFVNSRRAYVTTMAATVWVVLTMLVGPSCFAAGEKYSIQGRNLTREISQALIAHGYCANYSDCSNKFPLYGEYGDKVRINVYGVENRDLIGFVLALLVRRGIDATKGVPIVFQAFPDEKEKYVNSFTAMFSDPVIKLEISK